MTAAWKYQTRTSQKGNKGGLSRTGYKRDVGLFHVVCFGFLLSGGFSFKAIGKRFLLFSMLRAVLQEHARDPLIGPKNLEGLAHKLQLHVLAWNKMVTALSIKTLSLFKKASDPTLEEFAELKKDVASQTESSLQSVHSRRSPILADLPRVSEVIPPGFCQQEPASVKAEMPAVLLSRNSWCHKTETLVHPGDAHNMISQSLGGPNECSSHAQPLVTMQRAAASLSFTHSPNLKAMFVGPDDVFCRNAASPASSFSAAPSHHVVLTSKPHGWGLAAMQSLLPEAQEQRAWTNSKFTHRGSHTRRSCPFEDRISSGNLSVHGNDGCMRLLQQRQNAGECLKLLTGLVQGQLKERNLLQRCGDRVPRAATDPKKFCSMYYRRFVETHFHFSERSTTEKMCILRSWLFDLWTTDSKKQVMRPDVLARRVKCRASWGDFWLTDHELDALVSHVIKAFQQGCDHLFQ